MKQCSKCLVEKDFSAYTRRAASGDGYQARCKECLKIGRNRDEWAKYYSKYKEVYSAKKKASYSLNREKYAARSKVYRATEPRQKREKEYAKWYRETHPNASIEKYAKWIEKNPEKHKERLARLREIREADPALARKRVQAWSQKNRDICNAHCMARYAQKLNATPAWANTFFIEEAYKLAHLRTKMLGFKWNVDHIVPLRSKLVCGLHVENNLAVIPAVTNITKGNRHWPDMPGGD